MDLKVDCNEEDEEFEVRKLYNMNSQNYSFIYYYYFGQKLESYYTTSKLSAVFS